MILTFAQVMTLDTTFTENVGGLGGAIHNSGGYFDMVGGQLSNNSAVDGGAIYDSNGERMTLSNVSVLNNQASDAGGALYAKFTKDGRLTNTSFFQNKADTGDNAAGNNVAYWGDLVEDWVAGKCKYVLTDVTGTDKNVDWIQLG